MKAAPNAGPIVSRGHLFVLICMLVDSIGFGIIIPVIPGLIAEVAQASLAEATRIGGHLLLVFALLQFFCGPVLGNLSDRFGRRPVLLLSMLCFGIDYLLMAMAPSLAWLFVGRGLAGMAGAIFGPANAFLADITPPERRAQVFGTMGAAFGLGFIVGPVIGGLLGELGTRAPFYASACLALANFVFGYFVLPESLPPERRRPFSLARANPLGTLLALRRHPGVLWLALAMLLWQVAHQVYPSTWSFFAIARFEWSPGQIGASLAYTGLTMALVQALLTGRAVKALGERGAAFTGISLGGAAFVAYAFADAPWMVYAIMTVGAMQSFAYPAINALMSQKVADDQQGELQGGVASLFSLSMILGPPIMTEALARYSEPNAPVYFPGAAFLLAAFLALTALATLAFGQRKPGV